MKNQPIYFLKDKMNKMGGVEKATYRLATAFSERGCDVSLLTNRKGAFLDKAPFSVIDLGKTSKTSFLHLLQFDSRVENYLKHNPCNLIFGMGRNRFQTHYRAGDGVHAAYLKRRSKENFYKGLSFAINPLHRTILHLEKSAYENPDLELLFTNSFMVKNEIIEHYRIDPQKIVVIHNGAQWKEWQDAFDLWPESRETFFKQKKSSNYHLLFVGHNYQRKGLLYLLEALSELKADPFHLHIVGKEKNLNFFKQKIFDYGLNEHVTLYGEVSSIYPFYQMADAVVIPSLYDPFANVTTEALSMGLYVISSSSNGGCEILTDKSGVIIDDLFSKESFKKALLTAFDHPKTEKSSQLIRDSVEYLDFSHQLNKLVDYVLDVK